MADEVTTKCPWCKPQSGKVMSQKIGRLPPEWSMTGMRALKHQLRSHRTICGKMSC